MTGVLHDAGETEARMDLRSIPLQSYVDAGEHGLFLKLTPDTFVPVKIDANGDTIGWGTTIHVDEFPDISLKKLDPAQITALPEKHPLPTFKQEIAHDVLDLLKSGWNRLRGHKAGSE